MNNNQFDVPSSEAHGLGSERDIEQWNTLDAILAKYPHSYRHLLSLWPCYARRINVLRFLAHFKLYEMVNNLPGDIVEIGVSRGVSLFTWHKFLEIFHPCDTSKKIIGIDSFEGLVNFDEKDGGFDPTIGKTTGGWSAASVEEEVKLLVDWHNSDNILANHRIILKNGRVENVLKPLLESRPGMRISLLHLDVDLYEPTLYSLRTLWDLIVPGGIVIFDEYGLPPWAGEASAVDEFIKEREIRNVRIQKFPWSLTPYGFLIKPV